MRARNIKPGFFKNEDLAECSMAARLLFAGLWCMADREGRLEDRPKRIKAEILPYDNEDADNLLSELETTGFIIRYQSQGYKVIYIPKFIQHQRPHSNEKESELPPLDEGEHTKVDSTADHGSKSCEPFTQALRPESLNPDSHESHKKEGVKVTAISSLEKEKFGSVNEQKKNTQYPDDFERFWSAYPVKKKKKEALKAWKKAKQDLPPIDDLVEIVEKNKRLNKQWLKDGGQFIPHPATWLNAGQWLDELEAESSSRKSPDYVT